MTWSRSRIGSAQDADGARHACAAEVVGEAEPRVAHLVGMIAAELVHGFEELAQTVAPTG